MSSLQLFGYWRSSATWRVRTALALKGLGYDYVPVPIVEGAQHEPSYTSKNRMHQVPTLRLADGTLLTQSMAILTWLDATHPEPPLLPDEPLARARALEIAEIINSGIQPLQNLSVLNHVAALGGDKARWAADVITRGLDALEPLVASTKGRYAVGDAITVADLCLVPQIYNARRFHVSLDPHPTLREVEEACLAHPAFASARPEAQPDAAR